MKPKNFNLRKNFLNEFVEIQITQHVIRNAIFHHETAQNHGLYTIMLHRDNVWEEGDDLRIRQKSPSNTRGKNCYFLETNRFKITINC